MTDFPKLNDAADVTVLAQATRDYVAGEIANMGFVVREGTFSITYPSSQNSDGIANVVYASPLPGAAHVIDYHATDPTNGNLAVNTTLPASSANGFTIRGRRGGPGVISYKYTAVYFGAGA